MVILELFSKPLKTKYKNYVCSKATLFVLVMNCIALIFPFIFAYRSRGFWLKHDTFYEQPNVKFRGEYLFVGYTNNLSNPIVCNNFPNYQQYNNYDTCSIIKVREIDYNFDGKTDELNLNLSVTIPEDTKLLSMDFLTTIDYRLHATCPLHMQSAIIIQEYVNDFVSVLEITSNLQLSQNFPLFCFSKGIDTRYNESVVQNSNDLKSYTFRNIIASYNKRNISTQISNIYRTIDTDSSSNFKLNLKVIYPNHKIYYKTGFWQVIKWAWIQYFPVYVVFLWLVNKFKTYVFENKIVLFYEISPLKKER